MTTLYIRKIPNIQKNKVRIKKYTERLIEQEYKELLDENKISKIINVFAKKIHEDYASIAFLIENTSQEVKVVTVNDPEFKASGK